MRIFSICYDKSFKMVLINDISMSHYLTFDTILYNENIKNGDTRSLFLLGVIFFKHDTHRLKLNHIYSIIRLAI